MANLTPLHLDKDTGNIVARGGSTSTNLADGYLYEQLVPATVWPIPHNRGTDQVLVQVYDEFGEFTIPNKIDILDINNIEVTLNAPMQGTVHILFFKTS